MNKCYTEVSASSGTRNSLSLRLTTESILALMERLLPEEAEAQATATIHLLESNDFREAINTLSNILSTIKQVEPYRYLGYYTVALLDRLNASNIQLSSEQLQELKNTVLEAGDIFLEAVSAWYEGAEKRQAQCLELCEEQEKNFKAIKHVSDYFTQYYQRLSPREIKTIAESLAIKTVRCLNADFDCGIDILREQIAVLEQAPKLINLYRDALLERLFLKSSEFEPRQMQRLQRFFLEQEEVEALSKLSQSQKQILLKLATTIKGHSLAEWTEEKRSPSERAVFSRSLKRLESRGLIVRESRSGGKIHIKRTASVKLTALGERVAKWLTTSPEKEFDQSTALI